MLSLNESRLSTAPFIATRPVAPRRTHATRVRAEDPAAPEPANVGENVVKYAKEMPGVSKPFPNIFDPADFLGNTGDNVQELRRWRESEVTHGRVAMLATVGFLVQEGIEDTKTARQSPFFPHVTGPAINHFQQVERQGAVFWAPLLFAIALAEIYRTQIGWKFPTSSTFYQLYEDDQYIPGDLGFDPFNFYPSDPKQQYVIKTKELNNGRLAMIAIAGFVAQELVNKKEIVENLVDTLNTPPPGVPPPAP